MKVLTIKEPWGSLIINGYKKYEFRSWKTNYRGKILIHTSQSIERDNKEKFKQYGIEYQPGCIIGEAILTDCILVDEKFIKELRKENPLVYGKSGHNETYAWKLECVKKYDNVIHCKGKLGLWNYDVEK